MSLQDKSILFELPLEKISRLQVVKTPSGWSYIGTVHEKLGPNSRETAYMTEEDAFQKLDSWHVIIDHFLWHLGLPSLGTCSDEQYWQAARHAASIGALSKRTE